MLMQTGAIHDLNRFTAQAKGTAAHSAAAAVDAWHEDEQLVNDLAANNHESFRKIATGSRRADEAVAA